MKQYKIAIYQGQGTKGGSKQSLFRLIMLLNESLIEPSIYCGTQGWFTENLEKKKIDYKLIEESKRMHFRKRISNFYVRSILSALKTIIFDIKIPIKIYRDLKSEKIEIVILNETRDLFYLGLPALMIKNISIVSFIRGEVRSVDKVRLYLSNKVIALSSNLIKGLSDNILNKSEIIPNYIDCEEYYFKDSEVITLAIVGSIIPLKGHCDLIEVLKYCKKHCKNSFRLIVIGDTPNGFDDRYKVKFIEELRQNNLDSLVEFLGWRNDVEKLLKEYVDIILLPSQTEGLPRVILEGMSMGIPAVAYNVGGVSDLVIDEITGVLVEKNDKINMAKGIVKLVDDRIYRKEIEGEAYSHIKNNFSSQIVWERYSNILKAIRGGKDK